MNTNQFLTVVLDEKLQGNDVNIIQMITSHIKCEDCDNKILHNHKHNKKCKDCFTIHNQHECKKCGETKLILVADNFSRYRCKKCVNEYMKSKDYDEDLLYSDTDETPSDYFDYESDSDDELTSISDFDSDFEDYSDDEEMKNLLEELERMM